jgi:hypothetical protein
MEYFYNKFSREWLDKVRIMTSAEIGSLPDFYAISGKVALNVYKITKLK